MSQLALEDRHKQELLTLFDNYLKDNYIEVLAFGSRLRQDHHEGSDLDLVARRKTQRQKPIPELSPLRAAISESNLPFLVDLLDWALVPESFHREIEKMHVNFWPL